MSATIDFGTPIGTALGDLSRFRRTARRPAAAAASHGVLSRWCAGVIAWRRTCELDAHLADDIGLTHYEVPVLALRTCDGMTRHAR